MKQRRRPQPTAPHITKIGERIELIHYAWNDVGLMFDGIFQRCYDNAAAAEHAGAMLVEEAMNVMERRLRAA